MKIVIMEPLGITAEKVEEAAKAVKQKGHEVIYYETRTENTAELIERGKRCRYYYYSKFTFSQRSNRTLSKLKNAFYCLYWCRPCRC